LANKKQEFPRISATNDMEKFSFTKCGSSRYFYQVLWQFLKSRRSRSNFWGLAVAAAGGEMRSNYFQNRAPVRKCQVRLASLGDQIVRNFERKNQLAVLFELNSK
jgi:hypothetical protein